jgi:hypothetical protein
MKHKYTTTPSLGWLYKFFKPYFEKWATFELKDIGYFKGILESEGFDISQPVKVRGILSNIRKRPPNPQDAFWGGYRPNKCIIHLGFKKTCFMQGNKEYRFGRSRFFQNHCMYFTLNEIDLTIQRKLLVVNRLDASGVLTDQGSFYLEQIDTSTT